MSVKYPGIPSVIHGNGAVAEVMSRVCGGVIGYPITPSTEISEIYEAFRSNGGCNVWDRHPFFFEPEGEHSAQSGALGAALTGGKYVSNASSSQGILYGLESHYVTVGKKVGGFVLHVAARVVSKHSLNVMAGHDDVYALLPVGLHDPVRHQPAGSRRSRGDLLQAQRAVADPGRQRDGRLRHQPHDDRSDDAGAGAAARVPRRSRRPHQVPDGRPRTCCSAPRAASFQLRNIVARHEGDLTPRRMRSSSAPSSTPIADAIERDNAGALIDAHARL